MLEYSETQPMAAMTSVELTETLAVRFSDKFGNEIGRFNFDSNGKWYFEGDVDASAELFLTMIRHKMEEMHRGKHE